MKESNEQQIGTAIHVYNLCWEYKKNVICF